MVLMLAQPLALALALALALMLALMPAPAETRVWPAPCQHYCRKPRDARGLAGPLARAYPNETRAPEYLRELSGRGADTSTPPRDVHVHARKKVPFSTPRCNDPVGGRQ